MSLPGGSKDEGRFGRAAALVIFAFWAMPSIASAQDADVPSPASAMGTAPAAAESGSIAVANGFARATASGSVDASGFVTITNRGRDPDRLLALSSPSSRETEVRRIERADFPLARPVTLPFDIPPGRTVAMQPDDALQLAFVGLSAPLDAGDEVAVTLTFERAGKIGLKLPVLEPAAANADGR